MYSLCIQWIQWTISARLKWGRAWWWSATATRELAKPPPCALDDLMDDGMESVPKNIYQVNTFHYWFMMIMMIHLAISLDKSGSCSAKKRMMRMKLRHSIWQRPGDTEYTGQSPVSHQIPTMGPRPRTGSEDWWCYCTSRRRNWYRWCFVPLPQGEFPEDRRTLATGCHTMWQNIYSVPSHIFGYAR
jgi:hypothetical protein